MNSAHALSWVSFGIQRGKRKEILQQSRAMKAWQTKTYHTVKVSYHYYPRPHTNHLQNIIEERKVMMCVLVRKILLKASPCASLMGDTRTQCPLWGKDMWTVAPFFLGEDAQEVLIFLSWCFWCLLTLFLRYGSHWIPPGNGDTRVVKSRYPIQRQAISLKA